MNLALFVTALTQDRKVSVIPGITPFSPVALQDASLVLYNFYRDDIQEMPPSSPAFQEDAALWAATLAYRIVQLAEEPSLLPLTTLLPSYTQPITPAVIYSADLCLRYLPDLLLYTKTDHLRNYVLQTAAQWPFSSTGMQVSPTGSLEPVLQDAALLQAYADRVIVTRDTSRCQHPEIKNAVIKAMGNYQEILWPGFNPNI
ncbi:MAG: hypothetical protein JO154_11505 [Chitinophaga sp.]|uniref:hypothetical protein n=1 Tax=Chitinophaga sp. TaxID=1869181 RepID=UPI0025BF95FA|nr:hypothetical protein [Chitinophaga sp.]MBV8253223.1 hypothetical protein [Chitinophaga sp.]